MRCFGICLFINFFVFTSIYAQQHAVADTSTVKVADASVSYHSYLPVSNFSLHAGRLATGYNYPSLTLHANDLSFFCKKELQLEKAVKFPVKLRLGNITYTDKLEGKITARATE